MPAFASDEIEADAYGAVRLPLVAPGNRLPTPAEILGEDGDKLMLVQLPSSLPIVYPNDASQLDYNPLFSAADGRLGTIRIHRSGRVTAVMGRIEFEVEAGVAPSCAQMICIKKEDGLEYASIPANKIKFTVDVERLMAAKQREAV
jgi:hypothetical protein